MELPKNECLRGSNPLLSIRIYGNGFSQLPSDLPLLHSLLSLAYSVTLALIKQVTGLYDF